MPKSPTFNDGASYDLMMGPWSRSVGEAFLGWLPPPANAEWIDVGCGSGAFTALASERCAPRSIIGIDPSGAQLDFARSRNLPNARFVEGDALALPLQDRAGDVTVAALVVHFMPDADKGLAEMARVTRYGGLVGAYVWDLEHGGFPYDALMVEMAAAGHGAPPPPSPKAGEAAELSRLWMAAGLEIVGQREIAVTRTFADFDEYWRVATTSPRISAALSEMPADAIDAMKGRLRAAQPAQADGAIVLTARANAIWGRVR